MVERRKRKWWNDVAKLRSWAVAKLQCNGIAIRNDETKSRKSPRETSHENRKQAEPNPKRSIVPQGATRGIRAWRWAGAVKQGVYVQPRSGFGEQVMVSSQSHATNPAGARGRLPHRLVDEPDAGRLGR